MKRVLVALLAGAVAFAHTGDKKLPPSAAAKDLKRARQLQKEGKAEEFSKLMLACKRTMAKEGRYSCCIKGGCNECAFEMECACGRNLASKNGKGICKECYAGWHAKRGLFEGVDLAELKISEMEHDPSEGMSPEVASSGIWLSGTAQAPRTTPMYMLHRSLGDWSLMFMGQGFLTYTAQSSPRGGDKLFAPNWLMPMLSRRLGPGRLTLRTMLSLDAATITDRRYPLLFQTGETAFGRPIVDGQHPHSFFTELAASYVLLVSDRTSLTFYGGPRGEPALGPSAYPHRMSQSENPIATLAHHYQDATHIANNVVTMGVTHRRVTVEMSGFNGREPGEQRWQLERGRIDSFSGRVTITPTSRLAFQFSGGALTSPEVLHPGENAVRLTASAQYVRPLADGHWAALGMWGQNRKHEPFNSFTFESTLKRGAHWFWQRFENTDKDATLLGSDEEDRAGRVSALTVGYGHELPRLAANVSMMLGAQVMIFRPDEAFRPVYGSMPLGAQVFLRVRAVPKSYR
jgi:hypothetical protein